MINALKKLGKRVVMGIQSPSFVAEQCDDFVMLERLVSDSEESEIAVSGRVAEQDDKEFLPYTGIESKKIDEMKKIKTELSELIDNKKRQKSETEMAQGVLQLEDLLKQYF
ncbi:MAG: hypothetical protein K2N32_01420, partial [Clostridia bacterium]|nr:hypothetical protein [Clostridia bacterium]